jgi:hypothetical protein
MTSHADAAAVMLQASALGHLPMNVELAAVANSPSLVRILLDPAEAPAELRPEYLAQFKARDITLFVGYVVDDAGMPLAGINIRVSPSQVMTTTDAEGFFKLAVPLGKPGQDAQLIIAQNGFKTQVRRHLQLWPGGDWKYNVTLSKGAGTEVIDEDQTRRHSSAAAAVNPTAAAEIAASGSSESSASSVAMIQPFSTALTNSTVRVPRNIRVLQSNGTTVDYLSLDTYCKHVLPAEWIASWASYTGGSNSLNAGAVAVRCYAITKLNAAAAGSAYDICGTTSCQVYNQSVTSSFSDTAVNFTANWVVVTSAAAIAVTEYSAENNSLANTCGDGFTEPSTTGPVCIYDPICAGETRSGHGRGMCQWGTAKWATGRKFAGNLTSNTATNGYPHRDWAWIVQHYYPTLFLVKGSPLLVGDDVKALTTANVRACPDGGITNGIYCNLVSTKSAGSTGTIIGGPLQITADASGTNGPGGFTWYQVQWSDSTIGWSQENYLERIFSAPAAPTLLSATAISTNRINVSWSDGSGGAAQFFKVERAPSSSGPWVQVTNAPLNVTSYADLSLYPASTWYYRVRAFNAAGNSSYATTASATTSNPFPIFTPISNRTIVEGYSLSITNVATASPFVKLVTDFEPFVSEGSNATVLFRDPRFSGSTSANIDIAPDLSIATDLFATNGNASSRALHVSCNFTNPSNPWLRLTTAGAGILGNPVIDFTQQLRFDVYSDKVVRVAVGCRETTTPVGTTIGSDGGTTGSSIEWAGVTNVSGTAPMPNRQIATSNWTTLTFDFPNEPIRSFSGGNGVLSTASGLGVLEHVAIVPAAGVGTYNLWLDNFAVIIPRTYTWSLGVGSPAGMVIGPSTGILSWTPAEAQGPSTNLVSVIVTDNSTPPLSLTNTFTITVTESNSPPVLAAISDKTIHAGTLLIFTNTASDSDIPANNLSFTLDPGAPPGAAVGGATGVFVWQTSDAFANSTNPITVRVTDDGSPSGNDFKTFSVFVQPRPSLQGVSVSGNSATITWSAISGGKYRVEYKDSLDDSDWTALVPDVTAAGSSATATDSNSPGQRFYRILVL